MSATALPTAEERRIMDAVRARWAAGTNQERRPLWVGRDQIEESRMRRRFPPEVLAEQKERAARREAEAAARGAEIDRLASQKWAAGAAKRAKAGAQATREAAVRAGSTLATEKLTFAKLWAQVGVRGVTGPGTHRCPHCSQRSLFIGASQAFYCGECRYNGRGVRGVRRIWHLLQVRRCSEETGDRFEFIYECPRAGWINEESSLHQGRWACTVCKTKACPVCWAHEARERWAEMMRWTDGEDMYHRSVAPQHWDRTRKMLNRRHFDHGTNFCRVPVEQGFSVYANLAGPRPGWKLLRREQFADLLYLDLRYCTQANNITGSTAWQHQHGVERMTA